MTREQFKEIMRRHCIVDREVEDVIYFVSDLLEFQADEIKANEPYATRAIDRLESAAREVWNLVEYVEDLIEG
jgi:hypothetical protein